MTTFNYNGIEINFTEDKLTNITRMWKATGQVNHKKPSLWRQQEATKELIEKIEKKEKGRKNDLFKSVKGYC